MSGEVDGRARPITARHIKRVDPSEVRPGDVLPQGVVLYVESAGPGDHRAYTPGENEVRLPAGQPVDVLARVTGQVLEAIVKAYMPSLLEEKS